MKIQKLLRPVPRQRLSRRRCSTRPVDARSSPSSSSSSPSLSSVAAHHVIRSVAMATWCDAIIPCSGHFTFLFTARCTSASSASRGKKGACPTFSSRSTLLCQDQVKLRISNLAGTFTGSIRTNSIKHFGKKGAWAYPGTAEIFEYALLSQELGKATNFKFCTHIHSIDRNKSPLQISGKVTVGVVRTLEIFSVHHYIGRIARSSLR